jgi:hypothetical protein
MYKTAPTFGLVVNLPPSSMVQLRIYLYSFYDCNRPSLFHHRVSRVNGLNLLQVSR